MDNIQTLQKLLAIRDEYKQIILPTVYVILMRLIKYSLMVKTKKTRKWLFLWIFTCVYLQ